MKIKQYKNGHIQIIATVQETRNRQSEKTGYRALNNPFKNEVIAKYKIDENRLNQITVPDIEQYETYYQQEQQIIYNRLDRDIFGENLRRTKARIYDYANNEDWDYFITITVNTGELYPNYKPHDIESHMEVEKVLKRKVLAILKKDYPDFKYLLIAELQKRGVIHWHGLIKNIPFEEWRYFKENIGRTEFSPIRNQQRVSNYITKYITKEVMTLPNKSRYIKSRNVNAPTETEIELTATEVRDLIFKADFHKSAEYGVNHTHYIHYNETNENIQEILKNNIKINEFITQ